MSSAGGTRDRLVVPVLLRCSDMAHGVCVLKLHCMRALPVCNECMWRCPAAVTLQAQWQVYCCNSAPARPAPASSPGCAGHYALASRRLHNVSAVQMGAGNTNGILAGRAGGSGGRGRPDSSRPLHISMTSHHHWPC